MPEREFKLETTFTDRNNSRWLAVAAAAVLLTGVALTIWTSLPEALLPMNDESMSALIPEAFDGAEPLSLKTISQEVTGHTLRASGTVANRTGVEIKNVMAVIEASGPSGRSVKEVQTATTPPDLTPGATAAFEAVVELDEIPVSYKVKFRMADGPVLPHKDERPAPPPPKPAK